MKYWQAIVGTLLLFLGAMALYLPSVRNGFVYDDYVLIVRAAQPQSVADVYHAFGQGHWNGLPYYRPVSRVTMVAQKYLHGNLPAPYHIFNAVLAGIAAASVYVLFRQRGFLINPTVAFFAAAIVATHPITSSCVYPISGREMLMSTIFTVAAVCAFLQSGRHWNAAAVVMMALALLCREQAVIVPILFLLADLMRISADAPRGNKRDWLWRYVPVLAVLAAYLAMRAAVLGGGHEHKLAVIDHPLRPLLSFLYALQVICAPFWELVYEPRSAVWMSGWRLLVTGLLVAAIGLAARWAGRRRGRHLLFWLGWSILALLPTANLLKQETHFAERYLLLFLIAIVGMTAQIVSLALRRFALPRLFAAAGLLVVIVLATISVHRGTFFGNDSIFLRQWVSMDPHNAAPSIHLAMSYNNNGQHELAIRTLNDFLALEPNEAKIYNHRAEIFRKGMNQMGTAIRDYTHAIHLDPEYAMAYNNRAFAYMTIGNQPEALSDWGKAIQLKPDLVETYNNKGSLHAARGEFAQAIRDFTTAIEQTPRHPGAYNNLAWLLATCSDASIRDGAAAVSYANQALELLPEPDKLRAMDTLAAAYAEAGLFTAAVKWQKMAIQLAPDPDKVELRSRLSLYELGQPFHQ